MFVGRGVDAGYTVLELLLAVAFAAILAAIAVPNITQARNGYELETTGNIVGALADEARTNAMKRNRNTWILVTPATRTLQVQTTGGAGNVNIGAAEQLPPRVAITAPVGQQQLRFDSTGRPVNAAGVLTPHVIQVRHTETGLIRNITVGTTGRVLVQQ